MASQEMVEMLAMRRATSRAIEEETRPLPELRAEVAKTSAEQVFDPSVSFEAVDAGGVPAIWVTPSGARDDLVYLFFHGGGYVLNVVALNHNIVVGVCKALGARGLTVDYRVSPEHPYPAALDDARTSYRYLLDQGIAPERIVVGGSSAGGGLALALPLACRDAGVPAPAAVVPISPWTDLTLSGVSITDRADRDPNVTGRFLARCAGHYLKGTEPRLPTVSPAFADFTGYGCPILVQVGTEEILFDDARMVMEKAKSAGIDARLEVYDQAYHGWQNVGAALPEAEEAYSSTARFAREHLTGDSATAQD